MEQCLSDCEFSERFISAGGVEAGKGSPRGEAGVGCPAAGVAMGPERGRVQGRMVGAQEWPE